MEAYSSLGFAESDMKIKDVYATLLLTALIFWILVVVTS